MGTCHSILLGNCNQWIPHLQLHDLHDEFREEIQGYYIPGYVKHYKTLTNPNTILRLTAVEKDLSKPINQKSREREHHVITIEVEQGTRQLNKAKLDGASAANLLILYGL